MAETMRDRGAPKHRVALSPFSNDDSQLMDIPVLSPLGAVSAAFFPDSSSIFDERSPAPLDYSDGQAPGAPLNTSSLSDNPDYELIKDMENQWQEQRVLSRETHMALLRGSGGYEQRYSDTDSSSSRENDYASGHTLPLSSGAQMAFNPYISAYGMMPYPSQVQFIKPNTHAMGGLNSHYSNSTSSSSAFTHAGTSGAARRLKRSRQQQQQEGRRGDGELLSEDIKKKAQPRRAGRKPGSRKTQLLTAESLAGNQNHGGGVTASPRSVSSPAAARAEFDRTIQALSTPVLQCLVEELGRVREGKERVYIAPGARPPEQALSDERGFFVYKKVIPHQHKPEKSGDPSPKCFACAARTLHDKALSGVRSRSDASSSSEKYMIEANIADAREAIVAALGLPSGARVFEYELATAVVPGQSGL